MYMSKGEFRKQTKEVDYDPTAATPSAQEMVNAVVTRYSAALEDVGITADFLARCHKQELIFGGDEPNPQEMKIRQVARMDALKAKDYYPAEKHEHEQHLTVEVVNYGEEKKRELFPDEDSG